MSEPNIRAAYRAACPPIAGRILTAHEAAEADAMRAALVDCLLDEASMLTSEAWSRIVPAPLAYYRRAAWATVLALLLAPEAT